MHHVAYARRTQSSTRHIATTAGRAWYSGITGRSLCGVDVNLIKDTVGTAPGFAPAGTCVRCARSLDQTVRKIGA